MYYTVPYLNWRKEQDSVLRLAELGSGPAKLLTARGLFLLSVGAIWLRILLQHAEVNHRCYSGGRSRIRTCEALRPGRSRGVWIQPLSHPSKNFEEIFDPDPPKAEKDLKHQFFCVASTFSKSILILLTNVFNSSLSRALSLTE